MADPDKVFRQSFAWFSASIERVLEASTLPAPQRDQIRSMLWKLLGLLPANAPQDNPRFEDFRNHAGDKASIAHALTIIAEAVAALGLLDRARAGEGLAAVLGPALAQVQRFKDAGGDPTAFALARVLLTLSGDAQAPPGAGQEAAKLASLIGATAADSAAAQSALGVATMLLGSIIDRSFIAPAGSGELGWQHEPGLPSAPDQPKLSFNTAGINATLEFRPAEGAIRADLSLNLEGTGPVEGMQGRVQLTSKPGLVAVIPVAPGRAKVNAADAKIALDVSLEGRGKPVADFGGALSINRLQFVLGLSGAAPSVSLAVRNAVARFSPADSFLQQLLGGAPAVGFDVETLADASAGLRLAQGNGLQTSLTIPSLPSGPFELQLINLELQPGPHQDFSNLKLGLAASFGVQLGPFDASVDQLGLLIDAQGNVHPLGPRGIGLLLDAGIAKGGGFLATDGRGGYGGVLELKMLAVNVKAIALLSTSDPEVGFSLLLLIFGQFPPIQLSFGFTLTGIGGLIGVQHKTDQDALAQALSTGQLDAILFPDDPVANAPQIIQTLRVVFPQKAGGFVIGPMLELGWGTPSLVTVRLGLLVETGAFTILGQAIIAIPPLIGPDLALLYLRLDFKGSVEFDPLRIGFDAKLIHSRVALISITGQFAFRAAFGDRPTFLISAGGFHPRFADLPADIPFPFDRIGASLDIGIVGIELRCYFAITSATVQAGAAVRAWADIGIASIEGGFGFDAICYLVPRFYFELDVYAYLAVHVFGLEFAAIHLSGMLAGPGRWRIAGRARVNTPWPLPDFSISIDESFGEDRSTPPVTVRVGELLKDEIGNAANWSAQLPRGGEAYLTLANIKPGKDVLAHPLGTLVFRQKLVPFNLRLAKASGSLIEGANEFYDGALAFGQGDQAAPPPGSPAPVTDHFAAAQFLELSPEDRLTKPSFEPFTSGYELGDDDYELGELVAVDLNFEQVNLGEPPTRTRHWARELYTLVQFGPMLAYGAAGRSSLRDRQLTRPAALSPLKMEPPPLVVADRAHLQVAAGAGTFTSVWRAEQARVTLSRAASLAVVEGTELV